MGCGETLTLKEGRVRCCMADQCQDPDAVDKLLADEETEHIVIFLGERRFSLQHPLRERIDGELHNCQLHRWLVTNAAPVESPGKYRVSVHHPDGYSESYRPGEGSWDWERINDEEATNGDEEAAGEAVSADTETNDA